MRNSEHFNLNLVEGSDIVNPLVTDVPNYESIDEQMFKNQNAGVQNATELKNGTVHAITRLVPDAQMITFTATSNFTAGDTFTVDGIQVSALTVSGEQLPTGAYVINSQVLAILKGTLLTVYGIGSEIADNALALNGHPDTYFGTKEEVNNAINTANSANELVNEVNNSLATYISPILSLPNGGNIISKSIWFNEKTKYLHVFAQINNISLTGQSVILNIKDYTPRGANYGMCAIYTGGYWAFGSCSIDANGDIKQLVSSTTFTQVVICIDTVLI